MENKRYIRENTSSYLTEQVSAIFLLAQELEEFECQDLLEPQLTDNKKIETKLQI